MPQKRKNQRASARRKFLRIILEEQDNRCHLCGHRHALTLHHMIALEDEGPNDRENIVGLCTVCHRFWHGIGGGCRQGIWKPLGDWELNSYYCHEWELVNRKREMVMHDKIAELEKELEQVPEEDGPVVEKEDDHHRLDDDGCPNHQ